MQSVEQRGEEIQVHYLLSVPGADCITVQAFVFALPNHQYEEGLKASFASFGKNDDTAVDSSFKLGSGFRRVHRSQFYRHVSAQCGVHAELYLLRA